jgi:glucose-6-phosphate dehydrogenase assembly protein OpcA
VAGAVTGLWRVVAAASIDTELPDLWREAAETGPVSRAMMSNLVVVRDGASIDSQPDLDEAADVVQVAERHPTRTILLNFSPVEDRASAPARARIGVLTFGGGAARYGVEIIMLDVACAEASIPSIVRRLARGDVPTTVWWTSDLSRTSPPAPLVRTSRQLVYDSATWRDVGEGARAAAAILAGPDPPDLADLNWQRLAPLRHAIVHALASEPRAATLAPADLHVSHRPGDASAAWLLAAWFHSKLRWTTAGAPSVEESRQSDDMVTVHLSGNGWALTAAMNRQRIKVNGGGGRPPFTMAVPRETLADALIAELRQLGPDTCLREALIALARLRASLHS